MPEITPRLLKDAKAGRYSPSLLGIAKNLIYDNGTPLSTESVVLDDVLLLDISFYQRTANFERMLAEGIRGVIVRAGQNSWPDTCAQIFMRDAESVGMPLGSYWYYDSRREPKLQAQLWGEVLGSRETNLFCWADYEEKYGGKYQGWKNFYDFLEYCKYYMPGRKFGIYTGYYYWIEHSPNPITQAASLSYFANYPLWLAWYIADVNKVRVPKPWTKMLFWQMTDKGDGTKYGVGSLNVDMNKFMGTLQEYNDMFGGVEPPPPTNGENMYKVVSNEHDMSIRGANSIYGARLGVALRGTVMNADRIEAPSSGGLAGDKWAHVIDVVANDGLKYTGWVAIVHNGVTYCTVTEEPAPPTDEITVDVVAKDVYVTGDVYAARGIKLNKEA